MSRLKDDQKIPLILSAALRIILEQGSANLRMGDVAKAAGIATGTVYIYFQNKHELINSLYLYIQHNRAERIFQDHDPAAPFMAAFKKLWFAWLESTLSHPEETAFLEQHHHSPLIEKAAREEAHTMLQPLLHLLEKGKQEMLVRNLRADLLLAQVEGGIIALSRMASHSPEDQEAAFKMAWDGIRA